MRIFVSLLIWAKRSHKWNAGTPIGKQCSLAVPWKRCADSDMPVHNLYRDRLSHRKREMIWYLMRNFSIEEAGALPERPLLVGYNVSSQTMLLSELLHFIVTNQWK